MFYFCVSPPFKTLNLQISCKSWKFSAPNVIWTWKHECGTNMPYSQSESDQIEQAYQNGQ